MLSELIDFENHRQFMRNVTYFLQHSWNMRLSEDDRISLSLDQSKERLIKRLLFVKQSQFAAEYL